MEVFGRIVEEHFIFKLILRIVTIFIFLAFQSQAQMVLNPDLSLDNAPMVFNPELIKHYQIKSIKGRISTKKPKQTIRQTNLYAEYVFDSLGRISYSYEMQSLYDTLFHRYFYNDKGRLIYQSEEDRNHIVFTSYLWDGAGRIAEIESFERKKDALGIPTTLSVQKDSYDFKTCDTSCVKILKNPKGTPYMKEETFFSYNNKIERIEKRYLATNEGTIEYFTYNDKGWLIKKELVTSKQKLNKETRTYGYDKLGNVKESQFFIQGQLQFDRQIIVNEKSGFFSAYIVQNGTSDLLKIIQFNDYSYFD